LDFLGRGFPDVARDHYLRHDRRPFLGTASPVKQFRVPVSCSLDYKMKQNLITIAICTAIISFALAQQTQTLEVKIGERVKLAKFGGPNVELIINGVDQFDINVTAIDYENMRFVRTTGSYGYQQPGITTRQIKKADRGHTRIFHHGDCTVYYVPDMATGMNHAKLEVKIGG
jgi:hypothetical protein